MDDANNKFTPIKHGVKPDIRNQGLIADYEMMVESSGMTKLDWDTFVSLRFYYSCDD